MHLSRLPFVFRRFALGLVALLIGVASARAADPVVDSAAALEKLPGEFGLADGPSWDGADTLYVPDVKGGKLYMFAPESGALQVRLASAGRVSATFHSHGRLYLSDNGEGCIAILDGDQKRRLNGTPGDAKPPRPNDLVVDAAGGVYYTLTGEGRVMYIPAEGLEQAAVESIETPNGLILSPDGQTLYVSAYAPKTVWAYDVTAPGKTANGRLFSRMDDGPEKGADGMCIDRVGNVYCAGASDVWIWNPQGELLQKLAVPTRPINCTFGDADLKTLYITGLGGLYRQRMNVSGLPAPQQ